MTFLFAVVAVLLVFLANPINWKLYNHFKTIDCVWAFVSNIGIVVVAGVSWWVGQKKITHCIEKKENA